MTLRRKLLAFCLPAALAAVVLSALLSAYAIRQALVRDFAERRISAAIQLLPAARAGLRSRSEKQLLPALTGAFDVLGADWLAILDARGTVLAHTDVTKRGLRLDDPWYQGRQARWRGSATNRRLELMIPILPDSGDEFLLTGGAPSREAPLGCLAAGFALSPVLATERRVMALLALVVAASVAVTLSAALFLLGRMVVPVEALAQAARRVAEGRYGIQVPVESADEVGQLASRFNQMSAELERNVVSKAELEQATDFLDSVIETLPVMIFVKDAETLRFVKFNAAGERLLGLRREQLIGKTDHDLFPKEEADGFTAIDRQVLNGSAPMDIAEESIQTADKGERILHTIKTAIRGRDGRPLYLLGISEDITERKRTAEALRQAEKLSAVGELAAGVAHEINNPLSVILGFARAAAKRLREGDELSLPISAIERETQRCLRVVKDLLTFARRRELRFETFDLGEAVAATRSMLEARARAKSVELVTRLESVLCYADRHQLEQAVLNLVNNAVDAAPSGTRVVVRVGRLEEDEAAIEVEDEGPGIPPELRERVLEPFFTTKDVGQGTGLGLSLVHEIALRHRGRIDIADGRRGGALVKLVLPLKEIPS